MIDYNRLNYAYDNDGIYSLQLEVGDLCHQGCIYCYMNAVDVEKNSLTDNQIYNIIEDTKKLDITAIEWLGGEPLLRKSIFNFMDKASTLGLKNNIWTGGLPLSDSETLSNSVKYAKNGLISVHISTINPVLYEKLHPHRSSKDIDIILQSIKKALDKGYPPEQMLNSVTFTGLQSADDMIYTIDYFEEKFNIKTSLNVYHTYLRPDSNDIELKRFIPTKEEVSKVYRRISKQWGVNRFPMNCVNMQYCSATVAVLCDGSVAPCATIREKDAPNLHFNGRFYDIVQQNKDYIIIKRMKNKTNLGPKCQVCGLNDICWGCRSRSYATGDGIYGRDPRCFS